MNNEAFYKFFNEAANFTIAARKFMSVFNLDESYFVL